MARRLILGGTVAIAALLAVRRPSPLRVGAGARVDLPGRGEGEEEPCAEGRRRGRGGQEADRGQGVHRLPR